MGTQALSNAQRQAAFRLRRKAAGAQRLSVYVSGDAHSVLKQKAVRDGVTVACIVERLVLGAHAINHQEQP